MEIKKTGKGLKVLVGILSLLLLLAVGYIIADKFILNKKVERNNTTTNEGNVQTTQLTDAEIKDLHAKLIVGDMQYGLYYKDSLNIDTITSDKIIPYAVIKYIYDNGISDSLESDLQCVIYPENNLSQCGGGEIAKAQKTDIDKIINEVFNTTKAYEFKEKEPVFLGKRSTSFVYLNNTYYFGKIPSSGSSRAIYNKFIKTEQSNNTVSIYDKAFVYEHDGSGGASIKTSIDGNVLIDDTETFNKYFENNTIKSDSLFNDFDSKLNTYKHTFKKADNGKYYWYSSEIVK